MDLSNFNIEKAAELGADLNLIHPATGDEIKTDDDELVVIKLLGTDSMIWRNKNRDLGRKRTAKVLRSRNKDVDLMATDKETCEMLAACTLGWSNIEEDGEILEFSEDAAYKVYMKHLWIREQADVFINERANFFTSS